MTAGPDSARTEYGPVRPAKRRGWMVVAWVAAVVALIIQAFNALMYLAMGLGWGGLWYFLAVGQGVVVLAAMVYLLVRRKPLLTLPLPVLSALLVTVLTMVDERLDARICSPEALAAVNSLRRPAGLMEDLEFESEMGRGCAVHFNTQLSETDFVQHYVDEGRDDGWEVVETVPAKRAVLRNAAWVVTAEVNTLDTGRYILGIEPRS